MLAPTLVSNIYLGSARVKKRVTRADNVRFGRPPLQHTLVHVAVFYNIEWQVF